MPRRLRVLLIDDSVCDAKLTSRWLQESELIDEIQVVDSGEQGLEILGCCREGSPRRPIDLALIDVNLPRMSGFDVLAEMKADPQLAAIPVIMQSSSAFHEDLQRAERLQANLYLTKPSDADEFAAYVKTIEEFWDEFSRGTALSDG